MREATIKRATLALIAITLGVKLLGFVEKQVIAYYFGADYRVDAFFVAWSIPFAFFLFIRELIEPAFLPLFVRLIDADEQGRANQLFAVSAAGIFAFTALATFIGWLTVDHLATWLAPGFALATQQVAAELMRVMILSVPILGLSALTSITLNGHRRFALPASGDLILKAAPILCALALASSLGIRSLAIGIVVGCVGRLLIHLVGLRHELKQVILSQSALIEPESRTDLRQMTLLMAPLLLGVAFSQISDLADNYFASQLEAGAVAARTYARKIADLPILLLPYALSIVTFPYFSSLASRGEWQRLDAFLARALRGLALIFAFLSVATILLAEPIITLLLERGAFDAHARELTAGPLRFYAAGLLAFAIEALLVPFYFALGDTRTPVVIGILGVALNIMLTAAWIGPLGVGGVAAALTVSKTFKVLLLAILLKRKGRILDWTPIFTTSLRIGIAAAITSAGMISIIRMKAWPGPTASVVWQTGYLTLVSTAGIVIYAAATLALLRLSRNRKEISP